MLAPSSNSTSDTSVGVDAIFPFSLLSQYSQTFQSISIDLELAPPVPSTISSSLLELESLKLQVANLEFQAMTLSHERT